MLRTECALASPACGIAPLCGRAPAKSEGHFWPSLPSATPSDAVQ